MVKKDSTPKKIAKQAAMLAAAGVIIGGFFAVRGVVGAVGTAIGGPSVGKSLDHVLSKVMEDLGKKVNDGISNW